MTPTSFTEEPPPALQEVYFLSEQRVQASGAYSPSLSSLSLSLCPLLATQAKGIFYEQSESLTFVLLKSKVIFGGLARNAPPRVGYPLRSRDKPRD